MVSSNHCTTLRSELSEPLRVDPPDASSRRRRSLHRGVYRFIRDVLADGMHPHGRRRPRCCLLFSLTVRELDPEVAQGAIRELTQQLRHLVADVRYFWWVEFQRRGAIHFHGMILDPPWRLEREARFWLQAHWHLADIQPWVQMRSGSWFEARAGAYAMKDVRKLAGKHYEQDYSRMPKGWRTFSCSRLAFEASEHREHESWADVACLEDPSLPWSIRQRGIYVLAYHQHEPASGGCRLRNHKRSYRSAVRGALTWGLTRSCNGAAGSRRRASAVSKISRFQTPKRPRGRGFGASTARASPQEADGVPR